MPNCYPPFWTRVLARRNLANSKRDQVRLEAGFIIDQLRSDQCRNCRSSCTFKLDMAMHAVWSSLRLVEIRPRDESAKKRNIMCRGEMLPVMMPITVPSDDHVRSLTSIKPIMVRIITKFFDNHRPDD